MQVWHFDKYDKDAQQKFNTRDVLKENLMKADTAMKYLKKIRPEVFDDFLNSFKEHLEKEVQNYHIDFSKYKIEEIQPKLVELNKHPEIIELIVRLTFVHLRLPDDFLYSTEEVSANIFDWNRSTQVLRYLRVKSLIDMMDRTEAIQLWKDIVYEATKDALAENDEELHESISDIIDGWIKFGIDGNKAGKYTVVKFDDYMVALRFDRCPVFESVKHLKDREAVYLSYCWTGTPEQSLNKRSRRKFTPCTLYTSDHCIEFYWNNDVHPNAKPPSEEFWKELKESDNVED